MVNATCSVPGCERPLKAKRMCQRHYWRSWAGKKIDAPVQKQYGSLDEAIKECTVWNGDCLEWTRPTHRGYARSYHVDKLVYVHRYVFERHNGAIPEELHVDHVCGNRRCLNIRHLRLVTSKQNSENRPAESTKNRSGYRGVFWNESRNAWEARVKHFGEDHYLGFYDTPEEANEIVIDARNRLYTHNDRDRKRAS